MEEKDLGWSELGALLGGKVSATPACSATLMSNDLFLSL
jgi:hypothetical protein